MHKIPLNHKTIFVLDHSGHFASSSEQPIEFDAPVKPKAATSAAAAPPPTQKLNPLTKCLWSCNIEALLEFSRIVYDLHPQDKLIRLMVTKFDIPLNSWLPNEQGLEHISMLMGSVPAPTVQLKQSYEGEDMVNLCKALNIAVGLVAQMSPMQIALAQQQQAKAAASSISGTPTKSNAEIVPNTGRIVLFTSSRARDLDQIQEFMEKAIEKCNKDIEAAFRNEQLTDSLSLLKINLIELVLIDIVNCKQNLTFEKDIFKQNSSELRTHILSSKSGNHLSYKMIELTQKFYDLAITSVTNIPMKEELNASSSANYDVDILHSKALHDQLKICGLYKNCLLKKDAPNTVCLKWSNPKTNITEFNFSNNSFRITPIDVNSRPASCLTSFLLGGRCVLLEVPQGRVFPAANTNRVQSHVLYNQGNEIFMHGLNFSVKSHLDDKLERFSIDDSAERIKDFRINEFVDLMRAHKLTQTPNENESFNAQKALHRLEKATRKWPIKYSSTLITNLIQLKPLVKSITEESINDIQYNECIKCIEYYQSGEHKNEPITSANLLAAPSAEQLALLGKPRKDVYKRIWLEFESMLKYYQDVSERHRILYSHVRNMLISTLRNESLIKARASGATTNPANVHAAASQAKNDEIANQIENEKLGRKRKINKDLISANEEINLLDMWLRSQNEAHKSRLEFYGRVAYPNQIAQLYTHLKLDELPASKLTGAKIDM